MAFQLCSTVLVLDCPIFRGPERYLIPVILNPKLGGAFRANTCDYEGTDFNATETTSVKVWPLVDKSSGFTELGC
jgi:hypothetical protein